MSNRRWSTYRFKDTAPERSLFDHLEHSGDSSHKTRNSSHLETHRSGGGYIFETSELFKKVAKAGKVPSYLMEQAIMEACLRRYWTVNQLANMLNRHPAGLRNRYISPLVEADKLKLRFLRQGNRPDQAYTTNAAFFQDKPTK